MTGRNVTLGIDGWSNLVNYPVLGILVETQLIDAIDTTGHPHTADYLTEVMDEAMKKVANELNAVVVGVVTDNASNMANMRQRLDGWTLFGVWFGSPVGVSGDGKQTESINDTTVFTYGCQAHILNLIAKDLLADKGRAVTSKHVVAILTPAFVSKSSHFQIKPSFF